MTDTSAAQQLFDLWKKQLDDSAKAWAELVSKTPATTAADPAGFWWKPMFEQGIQQWARLFAQTPVTPDLMTQWKQFLDQSIEAWSRALSQVMNTDAFAQLLGRTLDQWLVAQGPLKRAADQSVETGLQALNLPSRSQVAGLAKQMTELEDRIERLEDVISSLARKLTEKPTRDNR